MVIKTIFITDVVTYYHKKTRSMCAEITGNEENTLSSVMISIYGHYPKIFIKIPDDWTDTTIKSYMKALNANILSNSNTFKYPNKDDKSYIISYKTGDYSELMLYNPKECDRYLEIKVQNMEIINFIKNAVDDLYVYECDVDYTLQFLVQHNIVCGKWYTFAGNWKTLHDSQRFGDLSCYQEKWNIVTENSDIMDHITKNVLRHIDDCEYISSRCKYQMVYNGNINNIATKLDISTIPQLKQITFDGEMDNNHGLRFSNSQLDDIIQFSAVITTAEHCYNYIFCNQETNCPSNTDAVFWFANERDLIIGFIRFILIEDVDIICDHNGGSFDIKYLMERANMTLPTNIGTRFGRSGFKAVTINITENKGKKKYNVVINGRLHIDTMRFEQEAVGALQRPNLKALAKKYLNDEATKIEFDMKLLTTYRKNILLRTKIAEYCMMDSIVTDKICKKCTIPESLFLNSALSNITPQKSINTSISAKVEGLIYKFCWKNSGQYPALKISQESMRRRFDGLLPPNKPYKGGAVLEPVEGYYSTNPVILLDFEGLYPSIIRAHNLCFSTLVTKTQCEELNLVENVDYNTFDNVDYDYKTKQLVRTTYDDNEECGMPRFITKDRKVGLLPQIEEHLYNIRKEYKRYMAKAKQLLYCIHYYNDDHHTSELQLLIDTLYSCTNISALVKTIDISNIKIERNIEFKNTKTDKVVTALQNEVKQYDIMQLSAKLLMNSVYGVTGYEFSKFCLKELAAMITRIGRGMTRGVKYYVENSYIKEDINDLLIVYGDTDSVFVVSPTHIKTDDDAWRWGARLIKDINKALFKYPINLQCEALLRNLILFEGIKKSYMAVKKLEGDNNFYKPYIKGVNFIKANSTLFIQKIGKEFTELLVNINTTDDEKLNTFVTRIQFYKNQLQTRDVNFSFLIESGKTSKAINEYNTTTTMMVKDRNNPTRMKLVKRKLGKNAVVTVLQEQYEKNVLVAKRDGIAPPAIPEAGTMADYIVTMPIITPNLLTKHKKSLCVKTPEAVFDGSAVVDWNYYMEAYRRLVTKSFTVPLRSLTKSTSLQLIDNLIFSDIKEQEPVQCKPLNTNIPCQIEVQTGTTKRRQKQEQTKRRKILIPQTNGMTAFFKSSNCVFCGSSKNNPTLYKSYGHTCTICQQKDLFDDYKQQHTLLQNKYDFIISGRCHECIDDIEDIRNCKVYSCVTFGERHNLKHKIDHLQSKLNIIMEDGDEDSGEF